MPAERMKDRQRGDWQLARDRNLIHDGDVEQIRPDRGVDNRAAGHSLLARDGSFVRFEFFNTVADASLVRVDAADVNVGETLVWNFLAEFVAYIGKPRPYPV